MDPIERRILLLGFITLLFLVITYISFSIFINISGDSIFITFFKGFLYVGFFIGVIGMLLMFVNYFHVRSKEDVEK